MKYKVIFTCVLLIAVISIFIIYKESNTFTIAENNKYVVYIDNCKGNCKSDVVTIKSKDNGVKHTYRLKSKIESTDNFYSDQLTTIVDDSYLLIGRGTWAVWMLDVYSLKDNRVVTLNCIGKPIIFNGKYLIFQSPSMKYNNVHPEIDMSSAVDLFALQLDNFNIVNLMEGRENIDYHLVVKDMRSDNLVYILNSKKFGINKTVWNNPKKIEEGQMISGFDYKLE